MSYYCSLILIAFSLPLAVLYPTDTFTNPTVTIAPPLKRLQGVAVKGRLMCGRNPLSAAKVKIVDMDPSEWVIRTRREPQISSV